jgi:hypothetical protein
MEQHLEWTSPAPLWSSGFQPSNANDRRRFRQPALLRFATDNFMDEYLATLGTDPARLNALVAQPETWRSPSADPPPAAPVVAGLRGRLARLRIAAERNLEARALAAGPLPPPPAKGLKLYQPSHSRYYLVTGCLVCRIPGLPDRTLATNRAERVSFVVRRLQIPGGIPPPQFRPEQGQELAFVAGPKGNEWQEVTGDRARIVPGEEQLPLSPATYQDDDQRRRRLFAGLVPVAKREAYYGANATPHPAPQPPLPDWQDLSDPRQTGLRTDVIAPWNCLQLLANETNNARAKATGSSFDGVDDFFRDKRYQIVMMSWYLLLDFSRFLEANVTRVWSALPGSGTLPSGTPEGILLDTLTTSKVTYADASTRTLRSALLEIRQFEQSLEKASKRYPVVELGVTWPNFEFPLVGLRKAPFTNPNSMDPFLQLTVSVESLERQVVTALDAPSGPQPAVRLAAQTALNGAKSQGADYFHIRMVFERPNCGPLQPEVVSEASMPFQLAGFFDPDAPARPIRIAMPIDTTPAGLRKFDKNTAFVMSDTLCGQMQKMGGLSLGDLVLSVLPWPFHKGLDAGTGPCGFGMVCSMSIPIITICAMILLMIIVKLFDIIFFWMPFFRICFRIPGLKAKELS